MGGGGDGKDERGAGEFTMLMAWFMKMLVSLVVREQSSVECEPLALFRLRSNAWHLTLFILCNLAHFSWCGLAGEVA